MSQDRWCWHLSWCWRLLALVSLASGKPPCPAQAPCQCTDLRMKCVQLEDGDQQLHYLSQVPYFAPSSVETRWTYAFHEMRIRDQAMTNLSLAFHWGALSVRRVEVTSSLVRRLLPDAFRGLAGVKSLNLSHNLLSSVSADDMRDLTSLEELVLHNNLIKTLHPEALSRNGLLARLYLSHNLLSEIPVGLKRLGYLTHLYLQYNNISRVPERAFSGLRHLIILDLGALRSELSIAREAFCGLADADGGSGGGGGGGGGVGSGSGLVALYLRGNILRDLDLCALGRAHALRGLNLTGSFFPCSCHALSFADRSDWQRRYGFAPHFVTYEAGLLAGCDLRCPRRPPSCPNYCAAAAPADSAADNSDDDAAPESARGAVAVAPAAEAAAAAAVAPSPSTRRTAAAAAAASGSVGLEIGAGVASPRPPPGFAVLTGALASMHLLTRCLQRLSV